MPADTFAAFYRRYVELCQRAGVDPVTPDRAAAFLVELAHADTLDAPMPDVCCAAPCGLPH